MTTNELLAILIKVLIIALRTFARLAGRSEDDIENALSHIEDIDAL
jgi:hypothetical protein